MAISINSVNLEGKVLGGARWNGTQSVDVQIGLPSWNRQTRQPGQDPANVRILFTERTKPETLQRFQSHLTEGADLILQHGQLKAGYVEVAGGNVTKCFHKEVFKNEKTGLGGGFTQQTATAPVAGAPGVGGFPETSAAPQGGLDGIPF